MKAKEKKEITKVQKWTFELIHHSDGSVALKRTNDGFNIIELFGLLHHAQIELIQQMRGEIKADVIERKVILDNKK